MKENPSAVDRSSRHQSLRVKEMVLNAGRTMQGRNWADLLAAGRRRAADIGAEDSFAGECCIDEFLECWTGDLRCDRSPVTRALMPESIHCRW